MAPTDDEPGSEQPEEEPTEVADDGMAPLITNTGTDDTAGDDADAPSG